MASALEEGGVEKVKRLQDVWMSGDAAGLDALIHEKSSTPDAITRGMLEDRVSSMREVNVFQPHVYRHVIGPTEILEHKDGAYTAQTSYIVVRTMHEGEMQIFSAGRYVDEIVIEGGVARFRKRVVVPDSWRFDTLVVIPL